MERLAYEIHFPPGGETRHRFRLLFLPVCALLILALCPNLFATATIAPFYSSSCSLFDLGAAGNIPNPYGGLNIVAGDANTLLLGGTANDVAGLFYTVPVIRGVGNHITGFGSPSVWGTAGAICSERVAEVSSGHSGASREGPNGTGAVRIASS